MRRFLAVAFALLIIATLNGCNDSGSVGETVKMDGGIADAAADRATSDNSTADDDGKALPFFNGETGVFDPDFDHSVMPRFKVTYVSVGVSTSTKLFSECLGHWAQLTNCEYLGMRDFNYSLDAMLAALPAIAEQNDGLIVDVYPVQPIYGDHYSRVIEVLDELNVTWMSGIFESKDYDYVNPAGPLLYPQINSDPYAAGASIPYKLLEYREQKWPDVPLDEFGWITLSNLSYAYGEPFVSGAAASIYENGLTDNTAIATSGGEGRLILQWEQGIWNTLIDSIPDWNVSMLDACIGMYYTPLIISAEPVWCALYAFMTGQSSPETLWPEWANKHDNPPGNTYASRLVPSYWADYSNYKELLAWTDVYAQANNYPNYPKDNISRDSYSTKVQVPEYYGG